MSNSKNDVRLLHQVLPQFGWEAAPNRNQGVEIWVPTAAASLPSGARRDFVSIKIPTNSQNSDFEILVDRAFQELRNYVPGELDSTLDLARVKIEYSLDELVVRRETGSIDGTVSWGAGAEMVAGAQRLLAAAAKASNQKRARFSSSQYVVAEDFLSKCRMGQTRVGSYVITALVPATQTIETSRAKKEKKSAPSLTGRQVTEQLVQSLAATKSGIKEFKDDDRIEVFHELVQSGVSYELLDGLSLTGGAAVSELAVDMYPLFGDKTRLELRKNFEFTPEEIKLVSQGRDYLASSLASEKLDLIGEIVALRSQESKPGDRVITISAVHRKKLQNFNVVLSEEQYEKAVRAHGDKRVFHVKGTLHFSSSRTKRVEDVTAAAILDASVAGPAGN